LNKPSDLILLLPLLGFAAMAQEPARSLDAGTWVRQSLTVVPAQVGDCPPVETFERRAFRRLNADVMFRMREIAKNQAREEHAYCEDARESLGRHLEGDWSGLLSMQRFDHNDLPQDRIEDVRQAVGSTPWPAMPEVLSRDLSDTLRGLLAAKALERSQHLMSSQDQNSSVAIKMKTEDVTDTELSLLRGSAHVLALRATGLDVERGRKGLSFRANFSAAIWSFDPGTRAFTPEGAWAVSDAEGGPPGQAGAQVANTARGLGQRILDINVFHFTTQILSGNVGNWVNPASTFSTNTGADLGLNRRFRYFENRETAGGNTVAVPAGYGYLDEHVSQDSVWRLRHIGGIQPYAGLVLEEVPGDQWGFISLTQVSSRIAGGAETTGVAENDGARYVGIRSASPMWELRFGARTPLGSAHSFFTLDMPFYIGDVHGELEDVDGGKYDRDMEDAGLLAGWGLEPGWSWRGNVRRLFYEVGAQAGLRANLVFLSGNVYTNYGYDGSTTQLYQDNANWLQNFEFLVSLHGGLSWSLTPWSGIGLEADYDLLDGRTDWEVGTGNNLYNADWTSVPGPTVGEARLRFLIQYVWK
jgi:hypothetical protein